MNDLGMPARRSILASGLTVAAAGCLSPVTDRIGSNNELPPVENPPPWLNENVECVPKGSLELSERTESVGETVAVAEYERFSSDSKLIVRFAAQHGSAKTCDDAGGSAFGRLLGNLTEYGTDPYRETHDDRPLSIAIQVGDKYYPIELMTAFDQILVDR